MAGMDLRAENIAFKTLCRHGAPTRADLIAHIEALSMPIPECGCIIFLGSLRRGYGRVMFEGQSTQVHRIMYEEEKGPIPSGLVLDHKCRVRPCWNPDHLEPVTELVNLLRGEGAPAKNLRKTHCQRGHEYTPDNTQNPHPEKNWRRCKACRKVSERAAARSRREKRGQKHD